ncbi:MAG: hypothetical protein NTU97_02570 [Candidatus Magasanikbacteria bacterium]|nr:hypothetical protein [Candidatus Magasanikbacteria bacterium]
MSSKSQLIRTIYLYAVSLITLVMIIVTASSLINLGLKTWVFTKADRPEFYDSYPAAPVVDKNGVVATSTTATDRELMKKDQEERYQIQKQTEAVRSFAMLLVALPIFFFHWHLTKKEKEEKEN